MQQVYPPTPIYIQCSHRRLVSRTGCPIPSQLQDLSYAEQACISRIQAVVATKPLKHGQFALQSHVVFVSRSDMLSKPHNRSFTLNEWIVHLMSAEDGSQIYRSSLFAANIKHRNIRVLNLRLLECVRWMMRKLPRCGGTEVPPRAQ